MCLYVALANVALGLRALQLLVPEILVMNLVCRLLQILHVCPVCHVVCVCVCVCACGCVCLINHMSMIRAIHRLCFVHYKGSLK